MKIIRVTSPSILPYLEPVMMDGPDNDKERVLRGLEMLLQHDPYSTFILVAVEEEEILAYLIAFRPEGYNYVVLQQAWTDTKRTTRDLADLFFLKLVSWAQNIEAPEIRMETRRPEGPFMRRWGFKPFSTLMTLDVGETFQEAVLKTIRNRSNDEQRTQEHKLSDADSETGGFVCGGDTEEQSVEPRDSVSGPDRSEPGSDVQQGEVADQQLPAGEVSAGDRQSD